MPVAKQPRKKVEKKADKADKVVKDAELKGSKDGERNTKNNSRKRKASSPAVEVLTAVSHPSHGKVCQSCAASRVGNLRNGCLQLSHLQVPGDLFVIGDGDCGQFGLGEDVVEATRPVPTVAGGQKVCAVFCLLLQLLPGLTFLRACMWSHCRRYK